MKTKQFFGLVVCGALLAAGFGLSGLNANANTLSELSAKAGDYCTSAQNIDCRSSATGNIYPNMESANF